MVNYGEIIYDTASFITQC